MDAIVNSLLEIELKNPDDFLKIKETLTRIGVASKKKQILYQSCHILHKQARYYIVHFKELFLLDGKPSDFTDNDRARRNSIARLLQEWNLLKIVDDESIYHCLLDIHDTGSKITIEKLAKLLKCSSRTIHRNMSKQLKKEKDLLNIENEKI